jgi:hypothetical protein
VGWYLIVLHELAKSAALPAAPFHICLFVYSEGWAGWEQFAVRSFATLQFTVLPSVRYVRAIRPFRLWARVLGPWGPCGPKANELNVFLFNICLFVCLFIPRGGQGGWEQFAVLQLCRSRYYHLSDPSVRSVHSDCGPALGPWGPYGPQNKRTKCISLNTSSCIQNIESI